MALDREQVAKTAHLARLSLSESELEQMTGQLGSIVDLIGQLNEVDTTDAEPMVHAIELENVLAEDVVRPSLPRESVLANAPDSDDECFRVAAVLG